MSDLTEALFEAHVAHALANLRADALTRRIEESVSALFQWLVDVALDDVSNPEQIMGVIDRYVIELKISGGITELMGEMSGVVFSSKLSAQTCVGHIVNNDSYEEFADKLVALEGVRRELIHLITQSSAFGLIASRILARSVSGLLFAHDETDTGEQARSPRSPLSALLGRLIPGLERRVGTGLSRYFEQQAQRLAKDSAQHFVDVLDPECVRGVADEIWDVVAPMRLSDAFAFIDDHDLEDFVVLGYEFWLKYRKTSYFRQVSAEVVARFFEKYGQESLFSLIDDMGVTEQMVAHELKTFLVPIVEHAARTGFLEQRVRAELQSFYRSPAAAAILAR